MRSRLKLLALLLLLAALRLQAAPVSQPPTRSEIKQATETVLADPNLAPDKTVRTLKWKQTAESTDERSVMPWLLELMEWFAQTARVVIWVAVALLAGLLVVFVMRRLADSSPSMGPGRIFPTHVQDLDIRPESLPDDIGAAARALWDQGDHRGCLSLLYRGLLSRLVHVHNIPIRDSSTEGDTLQLTASRLREDKKDYAARVIQIWQRAVYGGLQPDTGSLHRLCDEFAPALDCV